VILPPRETDRFYRIWWALLRYTKAQRHPLPDLPARPAQGSLPLSEVAKIREALWADDALRETFIAENPAALPPADLEIVSSWRSRVAGNFFVLRHLKKYTVFLDEATPARAYGVRGLVSPLEEVIGPYLPVRVKAVLLPFEDTITYDSILAPYPIMFGGGIRRSLDVAYRDAQERGGIITSLLPPAEASTADDARKRVQAQNAKILGAFRKALYTSGLSPKMVEQHAKNIETFASTYLLAQDAPRRVVQIETRDLETYLRSVGEKTATVTSFKRFVRFLYQSERLDPDTAWDLQDFLKLSGREERIHGEP
jgi:hypothetical protein